MKRRLSTRILLPNLAIVSGSLLLLAVMMLFLVRLFLLQETTKEFQTVRSGMETLIKSYKLSSLKEAQAQAADESIVRTSSFLYDVKVVMLTQDMKYAPDAGSRPLPEAALASVRPTAAFQSSVTTA